MTAVITTIKPNRDYKFNPRTNYYHVCIISRSGDINAILNHVNRFLSEFPVLAVGFDNKPYVHAHLIIRSRRKIDFSKYHKSGLYVKFIPIRDRMHFNNVFEYVTNHPETFIYHDEKVRDGENMTDGFEDLKSWLEKKFGEIEKRIEALENERNKTTVVAKRTPVNGTSPDAEPERIEIRTRVATFIVQKSRKGIALRIRFAPFIKTNPKGEYYLSLTPDEFKALAVQLNNALDSFTTSDNSGGKNSGKVSVKTGFKKALEE